MIPWRLFATSSQTIVQTSALSKQYKRGKVFVTALDGIDLSVDRGEIVGIVGPSGSGKTTFLNLVGGLDRPSGGKVIVDGTDLNSLDDAALAHYRLRRIGFIFQFYNLMSTLTALENVELPMDFAGAGRADQQSHALALLQKVGLENRMRHMPDELSGGEQQRVAIARALANNPSIILGDEPTGDLDSAAAKDLMDLLQSLRKQEGTTFLLVTHDPIVVAKCDRAYSMRDGKVVHEIKGHGGGSDALGRADLNGLF